ncbi:MULTISPECIES: glycosyltransferase family 87 protein [unclassified Coleofasciculus]|uniref:glycosyltransferase family 87 protein n=1 Tax=unclassified Coleofasciculus TaxID=2692782 RepID=UPI001882ADD9|nr:MULTISPECIES: glycosyltransferase family 87 protein [unclassified Coleofasciculus]MBE9125745.1 DUF2029 domain-containing protein [Coleofasciculus sp. LEGE 07081]MBE9147233.1 DUF2029 domain-containing protein [Coleofasciculus sp. LEGE 07092]
MTNLTKLWQTIDPLTRNLILFLLADALLITLALNHFFLTPWDERLALYHTVERVFKFKQIGDSWGPMLKAFDYLDTEPQHPLYSELFFEQKTKFQYPPTSLLIFYIFPKNLTKMLGLTSYRSVLNYVSWAFLWATIIYSIKLFKLSLAAFNSGNKNKKINFLVRNIVLVGYGLTFYPMIRAYSLGQIQVWINAMFAILLWCWVRDKKNLAGILAGMICLLKPQYIIVFAWGLFRKQWRFIVFFAAILLNGLLISVLLFGLTNHLDYLTVLSFISRHGEAFYTNQSPNGLLNRLFFNGNNLEWQGDSFPPFNFWVYAGTVISSVILISIALFQPKLSGKPGSIIDLSIIILSSTIASPLAWEHNYGILLPIYALLFPCLLKSKKIEKISIIYLAISYTMSSQYFDFTKTLANTPFNIVQSYLLIAGLIVLFHLYKLDSNPKNS